MSTLEGMTLLQKKRKRLLICGATGFIGRNAVEYFSQKDQFDVIAVYNKKSPQKIKNVSWEKADLLNPVRVKNLLSNVDIVIQAAAITSGINQVFKSPEIHVTDNAIMNSIIFREAFANNVNHLIFFSCTTMLQSSDAPLEEIDFDANKQMYPAYFGSGWTKVYLEKMCEFFSSLGNTKFTAIRHSNVYGPWDKFDPSHSHVFGATIGKILSGNNPLEIWGSGKEKRDFIYVSDLIELLPLILDHQHSKFEIFNAGGKSYISINELVEKICEVTGRAPTIQHNLEKPTVDFSVCLNSNKAKNRLGWEQKVDIESGIKKTMDFWLENM